MAAASPIVRRRAEPAIRTAISDTPVVCVVGARQVGKTTLVRTLDPRRTYVTLDDDATAQTAQADPRGFLESLTASKAPVTIDEVQRAPALLPAIKAMVDADRRPGRFLLTGSANLRLLPTMRESLAGRMEAVELHPLTEAEKAGAKGRFVASFLEARMPTRVSTVDRSSLDLPDRITRGGYPEPLTRSAPRARQWHQQYASSIIQRDAHEFADIRNETKLADLLTLAAIQTGTLLDMTRLANDVKIQRDTVERYMTVLERLYLLRRLPAWHTNASSRLVKSPKIHFIDSGLCATLSEIDSSMWTADRTRFGPLLESFVVQQIIAQAAWTDPELRFYHYRDKDQFEVDLVITRGSSVWAVEVKCAGSVSATESLGISRVAQKAGRHFKGGVVLYAGRNSYMLGDKPIQAAPLSLLWEM